MLDNTPKLFCFGYGYTCTFLGESLKNSPENWILSGTTRGMTKRTALRNIGIDAHIFDKEKPLADPTQWLHNTTHLLISTPPDADGDFVFNHHADDIISMAPHLKWVGYLSTTGVYGDRDGAWVDETSETRPSSIRGTRRKLAEDQWLSLYRDYNIPVHIFRLAGIYGPGRSAIDSVRVGIARRIMKPGHAFCRIHVDDIVQILLASMTNPHPGQIYNMADDEAAPSHEVIAYAARLLGKDPPPLVRFEDANLAPITLSFYSDNKRVANDKVKEELKFQFKYPNYRLGLEGCLAAEKFYADKGESPPWLIQSSSEFPTSGNSNL
jgi:hypothetical protein